MRISPRRFLTFPKIASLAIIATIAVFAFPQDIPPAHAQIARMNECPTLTTATTPIDVIFVLDDSGSMQTGTRRTDAKNAAKSAVDTLFSIAPSSRIGLAFMNKTGSNLALSSSPSTIKARIDTLAASGGTPMINTINTAANMLNIGDTKKDVIIYFSDGGFSTSGMGGRALGVTRVGIAFSSGGSFSNIVALAGPPGVKGDASFAYSAATGNALTTIFNQIVTTQTTSGNLTTIDADGDGNWPSFCLGIPNTLCGKPHPVTGTTVICTDTYDSPADFGVSPSIVETSTGKTWRVLFSEASNDLDKDGEPFAASRKPIGFPDPAVTGKDWYDHPFTADLGGLTVKPNLAQLANTINDLDLDGYVSEDWRLLHGSAQLSEPSSADVRIAGGTNIAGCVFPTALEAFCSDCTAHIPDPGTGRVPPTKTSPTSPPGPTKNVCQIEAYYKDIVTSTPPYEVILSGQVNPARPLVFASVQCKDGRDNNLDGLADDFAPTCPQDIMAPTIHTFTVNGVARGGDPVLVNSASVTLAWTASDNAGGSGIDHYEIWLAAYAAGSCDESTKSGCSWGPGPVVMNATSPAIHIPGGGRWWYGVHAIDKAINFGGNCITESGTHCGGVTADADDTRPAVGPIMVILDTEPPVISFDIPPTPASGAVLRGDDFDIRFDATDTNPLAFCKIFTSVDGGANWMERRTITACTGVTSLLDRTETLLASWCPVAGAGKCGVAVQAQDLVTNLGRAEIFYTMNQPPTLTMMIPPASHQIADPPLQLTPTVEDDGFLGPLTFLWEKVSGPGTVMFSSTTILEPTATFDNIGTYTLRLTIHDGFFSATAELTVIVGHAPPVVTVGPDQEIGFGLPTVSATISGNATDDGFIAPLTHEWTRLNGPEAVIADSASLATEVTFSSSGIYEFELRAFDGEFWNTDPAILVVTVVNEPPQVDAGGNEAIEFGFLPADLNGTATDDGFPNPPGTFTIQWTRISGPGKVDFKNPQSADTTVTFSQAGQYRLRLTANDGEFSRFADAVITYGAPERYGLVPCGLIIDDPATPYDETEDCVLRHFFLLLKILLDFALWKLIPLIVAALAVATGVIFYFSFGGVQALATVRRIWHYVGIGVLILLFSWLFLNFLLGILGFDVNIFGQWTEMTV